MTTKTVYTYLEIIQVMKQYSETAIIKNNELIVLLKKQGGSYEDKHTALVKGQSCVDRIEEIIKVFEEKYGYNEQQLFKIHSCNGLKMIVCKGFADLVSQLYFKTSKGTYHEPSTL